MTTTVYDTRFDAEDGFYRVIERATGQRVGFIHRLGVNEYGWATYLPNRHRGTARSIALAETEIINALASQVDAPVSSKSATAA